MSAEEDPLLRQLLIYAQELKTIYDSERERRSELEAALRRLREQDELKTTFVDLVGHELRTPVTIIQGYLEIMADMMKERLQGSEAEFMAVVLQQSQHLTHLLNELNDFTRLTRSEPLSETQTEQDLSLLARIELNRLTPQIEQNNLTVTLNAPSTLPAANLDPTRVRLILAHLLNNAVKFNQPDGWLQLSLKLSDECYPAGEAVPEALLGGQLLLTVANGGRVISPAESHLMFEAFRQAERGHTRVYKGLGLGLAIVRKAVNSLNGQVEVSSDAVNGTIFRVSLPYHDASSKIT